MGFETPSTKERVFLAGLSMFAEKGFADTTVREICKQAESSNMNVVNYYFGGKEELYRAILEMMFSELGNRMESMGSTDTGTPPEKRLFDLIATHCSMLFAGGKVAADFIAIYNKEIAQPSKFFNELIDRHMTGQNKDIVDLVGEILGPDAPRWLCQDCAVSVFSQIIYYSTTWVLYRRVNPNHPGMEAYHEHLADHVYRFSMAGLAEMKRAFEAGELLAPENMGGFNE